MRRILAIAIAVPILFGAGTATAQANAMPTDVTTCIVALKWAHAKPSSVTREDYAVRVCSDVIDTKREAKKLYRWADRYAPWALDIIG